ncbi:MAG: helix-turn-helix transcriptional regulator, partial [Flavobacteriaceae bacterium]|nr:helix-turn-helix transcriptional regulator [Flavobacteriaceae bacterium]
FFGQGKFHMQDVQSLSDQEKAVAQWVVLGRTTQEIVAEMKISPGLVKFHLRNIYQKLQVHNRQSLIKKFKK